MFKLIRYVAGPVTRWFSVAAPAAKAAGKSSKLKKAFRYVWGALDIGLTGYAIYELTTDSANDEKVAREAAYDFVVASVLPLEVKLVVSRELNDTRGVAIALTNAALQMSGDQIDGRSIKQLSFMAAADYIERCPSGTLRSASVLQEIMGEEIAGFIAGDLEGEDVDALKDALQSVKFSELPDMSLRAIDFMVYFMDSLEHVAYNVMKEYGDMARDSFDTGSTTKPRAVADPAAGSNIENL